MKKIITFMLPLLLFSSSFFFTACDKGEPDNKVLPLFLICGQSNANGNGHYEDLADKYKSAVYPDTKIYCAGTCNNSVKDSLLSVSTVDEDGAVRCQGTSINKFGIELGLAEYFSEKGFKAGLIKCGFDGSSINLNNTNYGTWWTDLSQIRSGVKTCYSLFLSSVFSAVDSYKEAGYDTVIKGIIWLQGESNAGNSSYQSDLTNLRNKMKTDLACYIDKDFYFVGGTISYVFPGKYSEDCAVNKAIRALKDETDCDYVESGIFPTREGDEYHWSGDNLIQIGRLFGEKIVTRFN